MFDSPQPFRFVQRNRPRPGGPVYRWAYVYAFFARSAHGRRKYVAEVHEYADGLFTMDFYAKLSSQSQNKYRVATNQFAMGRIGATLLAILGPFMASRPDACLGVLGASLVGEDESRMTKRTKNYARILAAKTDIGHWSVVSNPNSNFVFVFPRQPFADETWCQRRQAQLEKILQEAH